MSMLRPRVGVDRNRPVLMPDPNSPPSRGVTAGQWVRADFVHVEATRTVVASKRFKRLDRVEDVADVWAFGDAKATGHGVTEERGNQRGGPGPLLRRVR